MKQRSKCWYYLALGGLMLAAPWALWADAVKEDGKPPEAKVRPEVVKGQPTEASEVDYHKTVLDPAFDDLVNLGRLAEAIDDRDAGLLTDVGLMLHRAEGILMRPHRSKVTAKDVLNKAVQLAAETGDTRSLERIEKAAGRLDDKALAAKAKAAKKLASKSRNVSASELLKLAKLHAHDRARLEVLHDAVKEATLLRDPTGLSVVERQLEEVSDLPEGPVKALKALASAARKDMPAKPAGIDDALRKLSGTSRDLNWVKHPEKWGKGPFIPRPKGNYSTINDPTPPENRWLLKHVHSGRFACSGNVQNGGAVWMWGPIPKGHLHAYQFVFEPSNERNYVYIRHSFSGKYLVVNSTKNGASLYLWGPIPNADRDMYKFKVVDQNGRGRSVIFHKKSGKYVCSGGTANGNKFWIYGPIPQGHLPRYQFDVSLSQ